LSSFTLLGQQPRPGEKIIVVTETVDTLHSFDPVTYTESVSTKVFLDTMIFHNRQKVELRRQKRPYKDMPQRREMDILERNQAVRDTMIFINPDNQETRIVIPFK
jgi:hypothetical protein